MLGDWKLRGDERRKATEVGNNQIQRQGAEALAEALKEPAGQ